MGARRPPAGPDRRSAGRGGTAPGGARAPAERHGGEALLTRPAHVAIDPDGTTRARVTRAVPLEDGVRLELELEQEHGRLYGVAPLPAPQVGATVRVTISGGVRFPLSAAQSTAPRSKPL